MKVKVEASANADYRLVSAVKKEFDYGAIETQGMDLERFS